MRPTLNPAVALVLGVVVATLLGAAFVAVLTRDPLVAATARTLVSGPLRARPALASFAPGGLLLAVIGAGAFLGALFRSGRRVGPALRVSVRPRPARSRGDARRPA
jgi:hypothetical protein